MCHSIPSRRRAGSLAKTHEGSTAERQNKTAAGHSESLLPQPGRRRRRRHCRCSCRLNQTSAGTCHRRSWHSSPGSPGPGSRPCARPSSANQIAPRGSGARALAPAGQFERVSAGEGTLCKEEVISTGAPRLRHLGGIRRASCARGLGRASGARGRRGGRGRSSLQRQGVELSHKRRRGGEAASGEQATRRPPSTGRARALPPRQRRARLPARPPLPICRSSLSSPHLLLGAGEEDGAWRRVLDGGKGRFLSQTTAGLGQMGEEKPRGF